MSTPKLIFNLASGSVSCGFNLAAAQALKSNLDEITKSIVDPTAAKTDIEYQYTGDVFLEIFCNPRIWASPFAARVLITLRDDRLRVSVESELTQVIADVDRFIEENS
jgi:hypothetical protein